METIQSPNGKILNKTTTKTTTPTSNTTTKQIQVQLEKIEVIVSDSRILSSGSQWGHVALLIDGILYSRAHEEYVTMDKQTYFHGGTVYLVRGPIKTEGNRWRDSVGLILKLTPTEKLKIRNELERRVATDRDFRQKHPNESDYSIFNNSCSSNVEDVLEMVGILAHDPRWLPTPSTPNELERAIEKSNRLVTKIYYPKEKKQ